MFKGPLYRGLVSIPFRLTSGPGGSVTVVCRNQGSKQAQNAEIGDVTIRLNHTPPSPLSQTRTFGLWAIV